MWSSKACGRSRYVALLAPLLLSGCLHPLYGGASGHRLVQQMHAVQVDPIGHRFGHYLHNDLVFALNGTGAVGRPAYRLTVTPIETIQTPLVDTITGRATAATIVVDADYRLTSLENGRTIASGVAFTAAGYNRSSQRFADIRAARNAEVRDADSLADQIRLRIAAALADRSSQ